MKNLWVAVMELAIVELRGIHSTFGELRKNRTGWWSGLDLNSQDPSIQPSWIVVSIPLAMNWPHFLVADA